MTLSKAIGVIDAPANRRQIAKLEDQGVEVLKFPHITAQRVKDFDAVIQIAKDLSNFDWIIFTDIHAADIFLEVMQENGHDLFELDELVVCALGEAVVDRLRFVQVHSDVVPASRDDGTVLETIENYVVDADEFRGSKVLFIKGENAGNSLAVGLRSKVRELIEVNVYRGDKLSGLERSRLLTLLSSGAIDEFRFNSAEDVESILVITHPKPAANIFTDIKISTSDAITFQTLRENGLKSSLVNPV